jgi:MFS family permease
VFKNNIKLKKNTAPGGDEVPQSLRFTAPQLSGARKSEPSTDSRSNPLSGSETKQDARASYDFSDSEFWDKPLLCDATDESRCSPAQGVYLGFIVGFIIGFLLGILVALEQSWSVGHSLLVSSVIGLVVAVLLAALCYHSSKTRIKICHKLETLELFGAAALEAAVAKMRYILLVYLMVGYVFIVSAALEPLSCTKDMDHKWYMKANPQEECTWCDEEGRSHNGEFSYPVIATSAYFISSFYAVGIPVLFMKIMCAPNWSSRPSLCSTLSDWRWSA